MGRLVVVSNRIAPPDDKKASAGGPAVGVLGALKAAGGLWFGWSGEISEEEKPLKKGDARKHYVGFICIERERL